MAFMERSAGPGLEAMVELLRRLLAEDEDVLLAYIFDSQARGGVGPLSDVDVAVLLRESSLERLADLWGRIAKALKRSEERIDLVDISRADIHLKHNIVRYGIKLIDRGFGESLEREVVERYPEARENLMMAIRRWLSEDPSIDPAVIRRRLDEVLRNAAIIKERYAPQPLDWILSEPERTLALERALERIIESIVDACRHVVSAKRLGLVESQAEYSIRIAEHRQMPRDLADKIAELARLRNILAHRYLEVDYAKLHDKAKETVEQIVPRFTQWAQNLVREVSITQSNH